MFNSLTFYLIFGLSVSTLGFGYLSYTLYADKAVAVHALKESQEMVAEREKSLNLAYLSCEISDSVTSKYQAEKQVQQDKVQAVISKIDALPSINTLPKKAPVQVQQDAEIDIDSKLPVDLQRMLSEICLPDEGEACVSSR